MAGTERWWRTGGCLLLLLLLSGLLTWRPLAAAELALVLKLDPATGSLAVTAELEPPAADYRFPLHRSLHIERATYAGQTLAAEVLAADEAVRLWRLKLPGPPRAGERLRLHYRGELPALDEALDHRRVLQQLGPMAAVRGSFLPAGSGWYPAPAALFSYRVELEVPADQRALVPGRLLAEEVARPAGEPADGPAAEGVYRARFEFTEAASGIDLMAGPWQISEQLQRLADGRELRLRTYFPAALQASAGLAEAYLDDSARYIERYSALIGPYPFSEFSIVASPLPTGLGMPGLTYLGERVLPLPFIRATSLGHEVLHNWWGNGVLVDYHQGNWAEGLTTFMADYAYAEDESEAAARAMRLGWLRDHAALPAGAERSLRAFRSRTHGAAAALGYGKAAMVFVMLRDFIGEEAFKRGLRQFWAEQRFRRASWSELEQAFAAASGRDLRAFFEQWLELAGSAELKLEAARFVPAAEGEGGNLKLALRHQGPAHDFLLPVSVLGTDGQRTDHWLPLAGDQRALELAVARRPQAVGLDVDFRLWRKLDPAQVPLIVRQWILSPAPRFVLVDEDEAFRRAASELAARLFERAPSPLAVEALAEAGGEVLLLGSPGALDALYARLALPPPPLLPPAVPAAASSAEVWTQQLDSGTRLLVVAGRDADALRALLRPLPHYGAQSWLRFDGSRLLQRGVWETTEALLAVEVLEAGTAD